jgi:hypothetical protein
MRPAPQGAGQAWSAIIGLVASAFTRPGFGIFCDLIDGWVLTPGRRTITRIICVIDPHHRRAHDAYHRWLRDGVWEMDSLWRILTVAVVDRLVDPDAAVFVDLDDTVFHKTGRSIEGAGSFRDAVRSTRNRVVYTLGLNVVVITVRIDPPWGGMPIGLPVIARVRRKHDGASTVELARDMLEVLAGWLPDRRFELACDGAYASLVGADLDRVHVTSRLRRDAAVYELTPPPTGRRGRPRKKGDRLPSLPDMAATATGWDTVEIDQRGATVTRHIWSRRLLWYHVAKDRPLLLVVVRDPDGIQPDDYLITTDIDAEPAWVASHYAGRWTVEVSFRDTKQHLGGEDPQSWKRRGPERACYLALWIHAVTWLWYLHVWGTRRSWTPTPWYRRKTRPSFADALAALRATLWTQRITAMWPSGPLSPKIRDELIDVLATAA